MKFKYWAMSFILILLLASCSNQNEINSKEYLGAIYSLAMDTIMEKDEALSSEMKYIAIDMSNFAELNGQPLNDQDEEEIISYFEEKYKVTIMNNSYEQLIEKGLYNSKTMVLDGVLLRIELVDFVTNDSHEFIFKGSKYRAGDGAVVVKGIIHYVDGEWKIKESKVTTKS